MNSNATKSTIAVANLANAVGKFGTVGTSILYQFALKVFRGTVNEMIGTMSHMQDLVYLPLSNVKFPATTMYVYSELIEIVTFDIFPTDDWYPIWFDLKTTGPFSTSFAAFLYDSTIFVLLVGSLWIVAV